MQEKDKSPLVTAMDKKRVKEPNTDELLKMILEQVTKLNEHFCEEEIEKD